MPKSDRKKHSVDCLVVNEFLDSQILDHKRHHEIDAVLSYLTRGIRVTTASPTDFAYHLLCQALKLDDDKWRPIALSILALFPHNLDQLELPIKEASYFLVPHFIEALQASPINQRCLDRCLSIAPLLPGIAMPHTEYNIFSYYIVNGSQEAQKYLQNVAKTTWDDAELEAIRQKLFQNQPPHYHNLIEDYTQEATTPNPDPKKLAPYYKLIPTINSVCIHKKGLGWHPLWYRIMFDKHLTSTQKDHNIRLLYHNTLLGINPTHANIGFSSPFHWLATLAKTQPLRSLPLLVTLIDSDKTGQAINRCANFVPKMAGHNSSLDRNIKVTPIVLSASALNLELTACLYLHGARVNPHLHFDKAAAPLFHAYSSLVARRSALQAIQPLVRPLEMIWLLLSMGATANDYIAYSFTLNARYIHYPSNHMHLYSCLDLAILANHSAARELLLKHGAEPNELQKVYQCKVNDLNEYETIANAKAYQEAIGSVVDDICSRQARWDKRKALPCLRSKRRRAQAELGLSLSDSSRLFSRIQTKPQGHSAATQTSCKRAKASL